LKLAHIADEGLNVYQFRFRERPSLAWFLASHSSQLLKGMSHRPQSPVHDWISDEQQNIST
jgi:hypothetical protein